VLQEEGPLALGCLLQRIHAARDPAPAVMTMACSDPVELDLVSQPLLHELRIFLGDHGSTKPGDLKRNLAEWRRSYKATAAATN
jgi:hypothetical protein